MIRHGQVEIDLGDQILSLPGEFDDSSLILTFGSFPSGEVKDLGIAGARFSLSMTVDTDMDDVIRYHGSGTPMIVEETEPMSRRYRVQMQTNMVPVR